MKTKPTATTTDASKETNADQSTASGKKHPGRVAASNRKETIRYPDLEEHVPDGCYTTQDEPEYGKAHRDEG